MTKAVNDVLALGRAMGLKGFEQHTVAAPVSSATPAAEPSHPNSAVALAQKAGLKGFVASSAPVRETAMALATRLQLPGFKTVAEHPAHDAPSFTSTRHTATPVPAMRMPAKPAAARPVPSVPTSQHRFVVLNIAPGGAAALSAIESKMGQSFASGPSGRASWLQRNNADGSQTRAYPAMAKDADKISALSGDLGSAAIRLSVAGIPISEFSLHTSAGAVPKGSRTPVAFVDSGVPDALRRALGR